MSRGLGKKAPMMASAEFDQLVNQVSKAALIDALWCACQLGTDETPLQITTQAARNLEVALRERGDFVPMDIQQQALFQIDSDGGSDADWGGR